jgi:hypothetical protein
MAQTYWSTDSKLNCGSYGQDAAGKPWQLSNGGYVCYAYGTLPWYAAGAGWTSTIRVSAPPTAPVAYIFSFTSASGAASTLDFRYQGDATIYHGTYATRGLDSVQAHANALYANQPLMFDVLGLNGEASTYKTGATGAVTVLAECPNATACDQVHAQLTFGSLPTQPWAMSIPAVWDTQTSEGWSAVGIDDGSANTMSFAIYNLDAAGESARSYTLNVYDATGALYSSASTPVVPLYGNYGAALRSAFSKLPTGALKLQVAGSAYSAFVALQFRGATATTLVAVSEQVGPRASTASALGASRLAMADEPTTPPRRAR